MIGKIFLFFQFKYWLFYQQALYPFIVQVNVRKDSVLERLKLKIKIVGYSVIEFDLVRSEMFWLQLKSWFVIFQKLFDLR